MKFEERMKIVDEECLRRDLLAHNASEVAKDADTEITTLTAKLEAAEHGLDKSVESIMIFMLAINELSKRINPIDPDGVAKDAIDKAEIALQEAK